MLDLPFLVRLPASLADVVTCLLVFRLLCERASQWVAAGAAIGVVWSPVPLEVSGFHGTPTR